MTPENRSQRRPGGAADYPRRAAWLESAPLLLAASFVDSLVESVRFNE